MKAWILYRNIPFYDNGLKAQLYDVIKLNKRKQKLYAIGQILADKGHATIVTALNLFGQM
jgi:hypothetical protein